MKKKITASDVLREAIVLKEAKSKDYQSSNISESEYFPYGNLSFLHMIRTKVLRIRSVGENQKKTNFESLEDSLIDLAVYCCMFVAWLRNKKG